MSRIGRMTAMENLASGAARDAFEDEVTDASARLSEIKNEMLALLEEARCLIRGTHEEERAKSYWWAHIRCALDDDHMFLGGSMTTMQDTIDALDVEEEA